MTNWHDTLWLDPEKRMGLEPLETMGVLRRWHVARKLSSIVMQDASLRREFPRSAQTYATSAVARRKLGNRATMIRSGGLQMLSYIAIDRPHGTSKFNVRGSASVLHKEHPDDIPHSIDPTRPYADISAWLRPQGEPEEYAKIFTKLIRFDPDITAETQVYSAVLNGSPKEQALENLGFVVCDHEELDLGTPNPNEIPQNDRDILILPPETIVHIKSQSHHAV